jgi:hypothetical protein
MCSGAELAVAWSPASSTGLISGSVARPAGFADARISPVLQSGFVIFPVSCVGHVGAAWSCAW